MTSDDALRSPDTEPAPSAGWVQIAKYLSAELTADERAAFTEWLAADPKRAALVAQVRASWDMGANPRQLVRTDAALAKVFERAGVSWPASGESSQSVRNVAAPVQIQTSPLTQRVSLQSKSLPHPVRQTRRWGITFAAIGIVVGLIAFVGGWFASRASWPGRTPEMFTYMTHPGQRAEITLADGSTVVLNVASRLEVPVNYATGNRTLRLNGEALFTVKHHDGKPFTVMAGATTARVLGTTFVMRSYATDSSALVAVHDGKVAVQPTAMSQRAIVTDMQQVRVTSAGISTVNPAAASQFSFVAGTLTFEGTPLPAAIPELDRWYDADIRLGNPSLASRHIKGKFATGSLADLSAILGWTFDVRVVRAGRVLTLYPK